MSNPIDNFDMEEIVSFFTENKLIIVLIMGIGLLYAVYVVFFQ